MFELLMPNPRWHTDQLGDIYNLVQSTGELGFIYRTAIQDWVKQNHEVSTLWAAYRDGELVGVGTTGSHPRYPHLGKHGELTVPPHLRRQRIGTALYFAQILTTILKGRREIEDTIIPDLSPWMCGISHRCVDGPGFLPSLGYRHHGTLPARTGGFKDIMLWGGKTLELLQN